MNKNKNPTTATLWNRNFLLLWQGQLLSDLSGQAFMVGVLFAITDKIDSGSFLGLFMVLSSAPGIFLGPLGGTLADRHSRKGIVVASDLAMGLSILSLAALVLARPDSPSALMAGLFVLSLLMGITGSLFYPAVSSLVPDLVPASAVTAANSWRQLTSQAASITGRALGGALYAVLGIPTVFFVYGVSFFGSAISELFIQAPAKAPSKEASLRTSFGVYLEDTREGFRYVWQRPGLRSLIFLVACLNFFFMPVLALLPFFVESTLGAGAKELGWLMASYAGGGMLGSFLAGSPWVARRPRGKLLLACFLLTSPLFASLAFARTPVAGAIILAAIGVAVTVVNINILTILQTTSPPDFRGRVMGIELGLTRLVSPIGMGLGGVLVDLTGKNMTLIYLVCGAAPLLATLASLYGSSLRSFLDTAGPPRDDVSDLAAEDVPSV